MENSFLQDKIRGSFLGGAVGEALGYPIADLNDADIKARLGECSISTLCFDKDELYQFGSGVQMSLFTANGLLNASTHFALKGIGGNYYDFVWHAYHEWLHTQIKFPEKEEIHNCWIGNIAALHQQRRPDKISLSSLLQYSDDKCCHENSSESNSCGALVRVAPVGLFCAAEVNRGAHWSTLQVMDFGRRCAAITHNNDADQLISGFFAGLIFDLCLMDEEITRDRLRQFIKDRCFMWLRHEQNPNAGAWGHVLVHMFYWVDDDENEEDLIQSLSREPADGRELAVALFCAIRHYDDFPKAVSLAVNHGGDSAVCGILCGYITGAITGYKMIPDSFITKLALADVVLGMADDLVQGCNISEYGAIDTNEKLQWLARYCKSYPYGFPHLPMQRKAFYYDMPTLSLGDPEKAWPDIEELLTRNIPEFFYFNPLYKDTCHTQEAMLSIWYPCKVTIENTTYVSVGQYMQAEKARIFGDFEVRRQIMKATSKNDILTLGKNVRGFDEKKWRNINYSISVNGNYYKFFQNEECRKALLDTGECILVKDSDYDSYWGAGHRRTSEVILHPDQWKGVNLLGFVLMVVRDALKPQNIKKAFGNIPM